MAYNYEHMVECGIEQLRIPSGYIAYPCIERTPVVTIEEEVLFNEERFQVGRCGACPVVMGGQNVEYSP
jgi:hypothetical protein